MPTDAEELKDLAREAISAAESAAHDLAGPMQRAAAKDARENLLAAIDDAFASRATAPAERPVPQGEVSRSQRMRDAGFTARDKRLTCDECGAKFTAQFAPLHECASAAASKEPKE